MSAKPPTGLGDITPEWLTAALREGGTIAGARVVSCDATVIGEGAGFMGQLAQVRLTYDQPEEGVPQTLIAKLPAAAPENREVAMFFRFYEREVRFYEQVAQTVELRTPRCYFSTFDPATGNYALLLEDLAPACVGDQLAGCAVERAELCLRELAKFHAAWWDDARLDALDWMPGLDAEWYVQSVVEGHADAWPAFAEHFGHHLTPPLRRVFEDFGKHVPFLMNDLASRPVTIVHGDYRLDNLFFPTEQGGDPLAVIDWQISSRGRGVFDVAYFAAGTLAPEERRAKERDLLRLYHETLVERGVKGYAFERCWRDYRMSSLLLIAYSVIAIGSLDMANERGVELFTTILKRTVAAIEDLQAPDLLPA